MASVRSMSELFGHTNVGRAKSGQKVGREIVGVGSDMYVLESELS